MILLLAAFGLAWIVGKSTISYPVRLMVGGDEDVKPLVPHVGPFLVAMVECPGCIGFHVGWLYELLIGTGAVSGPRWFQVVAVGCTVAGFNVIAGRITRII